MLTGTQGTYTFDSRLGWMALAWEDERLTRFTFGHPSGTAALASLEADGIADTQSSAFPPGWIHELAERLASYAAGSNERFDDVPLDLSHLSAFQARVVKACRRIGRGRVRTYGELAASCGSAGAARAVGNVMAQNRFPIIVPCHRVVGSAGSLGGFSARAVIGKNHSSQRLDFDDADRTENAQRLSRLPARGDDPARAADCNGTVGLSFVRL
jgi:methylated-DNA-[protein]-cysteine S-methyltransferase